MSGLSRIPRLDRYARTPSLASATQSAPIRHLPRPTRHNFSRTLEGVHPPAVRAEIKRLIEAGVNDCEISRRTGIPRSTVREIRRPTYVRKTRSSLCPRCWKVSKPMVFSPEDYAELLGFYLGDGSIDEYARTQRLRIALDSKYPGIIELARGLLERCFPQNRVDLVPYRDGDCFAVSVYSSHLGCLFPQHGPGKKHNRPIVLESWQREIVEAEPWSFIRACIWTDGCSFINRTDVHRDQPYEYLSFDFANKSSDIANLFVSACDRVGVTTRPSCSSDIWRVRINQRESVALMLEHVGMKV